MPKISVAIVDDDQLVVELLSSFLSNRADMEVVGTFSDGADFVEALRSGTPVPDLVLLDLRMQRMNGVDTTAILRKEFNRIKIVVLSSFYKRSFMGFMLKSGVNAFVSKDLTTEQLTNIINEVHAKGHYFNPDQLEVIKEQLSSRVPQPMLDAENLLSQRELEVLQLICQQLTAKEIGEKLFIAQRTVEGHKNSILLKTGTKNTAGLVLYAVQHRLIDADALFLG